MKDLKEISTRMQHQFADCENLFRERENIFSGVLISIDNLTQIIQTVILYYCSRF